MRRVKPPKAPKHPSFPASPGTARIPHRTEVADNEGRAEDGRGPFAQFAIIAMSVIFGILGSILASLIQSKAFGSNVTAVGVLIIIGILFIGLAVNGWLQSRNRPFRFNTYWISVTIVTLIIGEATLLAWLNARAIPPPTTFIILDATGGADRSFAEMGRQVQFGAALGPDDSRFGARIHGGRPDAPEQCDSSLYMLPTTDLSHAKIDLGNGLPKVVPGGHASLSKTIQTSLQTDLRDERGALRLVVILASGLDSHCDAADGSVPSYLTANLPDNLVVLIIGVGTFSREQVAALRGYAGNLKGGCFRQAPTEEIPYLLWPFSSYGTSFYGC